MKVLDYDGLKRFSEIIKNKFSDFKSEMEKTLGKKEDTINRGAVNGYASLDDKGKVPKNQLPDEALKEYNLEPYAKAEEVKKTYATKDEVSKVSLGYTAENAENKGKAGGYASLDDSGKVPASQLPSYVDDVLEFNSKSVFPNVGETGKIYVDLSTKNIYRWSGSAYTEIAPSLITQAQINKLDGIEEGAEKNNVTDEMIKRWDNKWSSANGEDLSGGTVVLHKMPEEYIELMVWINGIGDIPLEFWIGYFNAKIKLLEKNKLNVKSLSLEDYENLTTKDPNTIYLTY